MIHKIAHFAAWTLNNPYTLAPMCIALVFVPILGIWAVHKYNWQHWAPFDKGHKKQYNYYTEDLRRSNQRCPAVRIYRNPVVGNHPPLDIRGGPLSYSGVKLSVYWVQRPHSIRISPSLTECSSVWQSTRFGSEKSQVQILSPRFLI